MISTPKFGFKKPIQKSSVLITPLVIYTAPGCSACTDIKEMCERKGIEFQSFDRKNHSEYVNKKTDNCRYVPNVFNSNGEYIGGTEDLNKLIDDMKIT
jgi:glutaredoxin